MIGGLTVILAGPITIAMVLLLTLPFNIFQSWMAAKMWVLLVVPLTGWPAFSWAVFFGIGAITRCIHSRDYLDRREEDKTDFERDHPWLYALSKSFFLGVFAPICLYIGCWFVARIVL